MGRDHIGLAFAAVAAGRAADGGVPAMGVVGASAWGARLRASTALPHRICRSAAPAPLVRLLLQHRGSRRVGAFLALAQADGSLAFLDALGGRIRLLGRWPDPHRALRAWDRKPRWRSQQRPLRSRPPSRLLPRNACARRRPSSRHRATDRSASSRRHAAPRCADRLRTRLHGTAGGEIVEQLLEILGVRSS